MFELEIATSTDFSFSRSSQHIFLGFSSQKRCQKRISAKWHTSPKKTFQKMKFLHLIATISRHMYYNKFIISLTPEMQVKSNLCCFVFGYIHTIYDFSSQVFVQFQTANPSQMQSLSTVSRTWQFPRSPTISEFGSLFLLLLLTTTAQSHKWVGTQSLS